VGRWRRYYLGRPRADSFSNPTPPTHTFFHAQKMTDDPLKRKHSHHPLVANARKHGRRNLQARARATAPRGNRSEAIRRSSAPPAARHAAARNSAPSSQTRGTPESCSSRRSKLARTPIASAGRPCTQSAAGSARRRDEPQEATEGALDKIILLLVSGVGRSTITEAVGKLGLAGDAAATAIAEAQTRIAIAARWDRNEQMGTALVRLNDCYRRALGSEDAKTALAVQREINRLLTLSAPPAPDPAPLGTAMSAAATDSDAAAARAHLAALGFEDEGISLAEMCRLTVLRVITDARKPGIPMAPRTRRQTTRATGPRRPRHRANSAD